MEQPVKFATALVLGLSLMYGQFAGASRFGAMHMTDDQERELSAWCNQLKLYEAPEGYVHVPGVQSVLHHFDYDPEQREQAPTGTCWAWSSSAMMSMDFDRQFNGQPRLKNGLSVQLLASNAFMVGSNLNSGGHAGKTKAFYDMTGYAIPSTNTGAHWDASFSVGDVRPAQIASGQPWSRAGNTAFPIERIDIALVKTWGKFGVSQADAIMNLKSILDANHPVGLLYFLPTTADWDRFDAFWAHESASAIINMDLA